MCFIQIEELSGIAKLLRLVREVTPCFQAGRPRSQRDSEQAYDTNTINSEKAKDTKVIE